MENEKKIFTRIEDFSLFEPDGKENNDLRIDFPEIAEDPAFKKLRAKQLRFVWMVANRTSPIISVDKEKRSQKAVEIIYGGNWKNNSEAKDLAELRWHEDVKRAIERMGQFNPSVRLRGRLMTEYIFDQLQTIIIATPENIKNMDFDSRKKYTELILKVNSDLPQVISNMEKGYGIVIKKTKDEYKVTMTASALSNELGNNDQ